MPQSQDLIEIPVLTLSPKYTNRFDDDHWMVEFTLVNGEVTEDHFIICISYEELISTTESVCKVFFQEDPFKLDWPPRVWA